MFSKSLIEAKLIKEKVLFDLSLYFKINYGLNVIIFNVIFCWKKNKSTHSN